MHTRVNHVSVKLAVWHRDTRAATEPTATAIAQHTQAIVLGHRPRLAYACSVAAVEALHMRASLRCIMRIMPPYTMARSNDRSTLTIDRVDFFDSEGPPFFLVFVSGLYSAEVQSVRKGISGWLRARFWQTVQGSILLRCFKPSKMNI